MNYCTPEDEAETRDVYPARDAERSEQIFTSEKREMLARIEAPIGVFDSGAGGLTILAALRKELPGENYTYFGDTAHCPYGMRSEAEITELTLTACHFLIEQGVKLIVVGCNTASQAALSPLRATISSVSFVGVVPAVKPAARVTKRGCIGVLATNQASKAAYLHQLIDDFAEGIQVHVAGCPELVTLVEHGKLDGPVVEETLCHVLQPLLSEGIDVLVLGCTHFPALRPAIAHVVGKNVQIIDSGTAIARRTHAILLAEGSIHPLGNHQVTSGELQIWCSGDAQAFSEVASKILGYPVIAHQITL